MKSKIIIVLLALSVCTSITSNAIAKAKTTIATSNAINIKLKNDEADEITVINAGSGGTYRLQKNIVTTIKMDEGDKLFMYEKGKKGALLLVATASMDGKVQLLSKL